MASMGRLGFPKMNHLPFEKKYVRGSDVFAYSSSFSTRHSEEECRFSHMDLALSCFNLQ
jgi:hypothetical protein